MKTRIEFFSSSKSHHHRGDVSCVAAASPVKNSNSFGQAKLALSPKVGYHGDGSSSHQPVTGYSLKTPPRISSAMDSPNKSPVQLAEKHGRILHQYNKLAKKIEPLTATIKKNSKVKVHTLLLAIFSVLVSFSWRSTAWEEAFAGSPMASKRKDFCHSLQMAKMKDTSQPVPWLTIERTTDFPSHYAHLVFPFWSVLLCP